jgi:hypothetical protein
LRSCATCTEPTSATGELGSRVDASQAAFFLANAALVAQELGDVERARGYYAKLAEIAPQHTALARSRIAGGSVPVLTISGAPPSRGNGAHMSAQPPKVSDLGGEELVSGGRSVPPTSNGELTSHAIPVHDMASDERAAHERAAHDSAVQDSAHDVHAAAQDSGARDSAAPTAAAHEPPAASEPPRAPSHAPAYASERPAAATSAPPARSALERSGSAPPEARPLSPAAVAELREQLAKQEGQNRFHEVVKTLVALGDAVSEPEERVQFYTRAADLYANKFMNQAEAVKANEKIFAIDPGNSSAR